MTLTVLSVAHPLAPVAPDTAGGAEQVLGQLDRALVERGHRSVVVACEGSRVAGELIATPAPPAQIGEQAKHAAQRNHAAALARVLRSRHIDVVHMHGIDFHSYMPPPGPPTLVTLHLPLPWYSPQALRPNRPQTYLHCVSRAQHASAAADLNLLGPIENGVDLDAFAPAQKRDFALFLGRICPEKGVHLAIDAADRAGMPLLIAGRVFGYPEHRNYFSEQVAPRLNRNCRLLGPVGPSHKVQLLASARCVLLPFLADETSSLVAREALASGTPVVAFPRGALPETIEHGRTGFLVRNVEEMAAAIHACGVMDSAACRRSAEQQFSLSAMIERYLRLYRSFASAQVAA
jgi:glycosyltransferase involved in cell wall biosynthesis